MPPKSKVERSSHFNEIVDLLLDGWSGRKVSAYMKEQYNEDIGYNSINNYKKKYLDVEAAVEMEVQKKKKKAEQKKKNDVVVVDVDEVKQKKAEAVKRDVERKTRAQDSFDRAVAKGVNTRALLSEIISYGSEVLVEVMTDEDISSDAKLKLILQAAKEEREWVKNDEPVVNIDNNVGSLFDEDLIREAVERKREKYG